MKTFLKDFFKTCRNVVSRKFNLYRLFPYIFFVLNLSVIVYTCYRVRILIRQAQRKDKHDAKCLKPNCQSGYTESCSPRNISFGLRRHNHSHHNHNHRRRTALVLLQSSSSDTSSSSESENEISRRSDDDDFSLHAVSREF